MDRTEFSLIVKGMKAVYTQPAFIPDKDAFDIWYSMLQDLPYKVAAMSTQQYMAMNKFPPTIADIREGCANMQSEEEDNESKAWDKVYKAICNSTYNSESEFEKLPPIAQKVVGSPNQLRAWAMDESFNAGVESSNFKRLYVQGQEREKKQLQLPESLRAEIGCNVKMGIESK